MSCVHPIEGLSIIEATKETPDRVKCTCGTELGTLSDWGAGVEMRDVVSSNVKAIGYCAPLKFFRIDFKNNTRYGFFPVPEEIWAGLNRPGVSVGSLFAQAVRGKYAGILVRSAKIEGAKS